MHKAILTACALLPAGLAAQDRDANGRDQYDQLVAGFAKHAETEGSTDAKVAPLLDDVSPYHERFMAAAEEHAGTDAELLFLGWLLQNAPRNPKAHSFAVKAVEALAKHKVEAGDLPSYKDSRNAVRHLKYNQVSDEVFAKTLLDAKALAIGAEDAQTREASARSVFKLERLQVGMVAPEIVAKDLDGVEFELSDYRGKVVVIDFWGDW